MRIFRIIGLAALLMVGASSASAQVYYDMMELSGQSGYQSTIYETVTTADFLRAPANGVQRLAFTRGSAFTATVYACETKKPADPATAGTCTSVATLSATNPSIEITTGRMWLIVDVTAAETAGNVSYLTIRSHPTQQLSGGGSARTQISTFGELQTLFASGTGYAYISNTLTATSTGDVAGTAFPLTVPNDGSRVDIDIEWRDGASMIWNSTGTQPGAGSLRNGIQVNFGNGGQAENSRVVLRNLRYRHHIDGSLAGLTATEHQGVVFVNSTTTGPVKNSIELWNPDISHRDDGSSSIAGGVNPGSPMRMEINGGRLHGPIGWDVKMRCDPSDCSGAGAFFFGTAISSDSEFNTPRCIKADYQGIGFFDGGTVKSCYFDMVGDSSAYVNGTTFLNMPATQASNEAVFLMSGNSTASGDFFLRGAGTTRTDVEGLVVINSSFRGSFDLSGTAADCLGPFWYSPAGNASSGWGVLNTSGNGNYGSGRITLRGPTDAGTVCGPRAAANNSSAELAGGNPFGVDVGFQKLFYHTLENVSLNTANQAGAGTNHIAGYRFTITNDTAVGACTDAASDGTLDGGGSATSTCAWNGTAWVSSP